MHFVSHESHYHIFGGIHRPKIDQIGLTRESHPVLPQLGGHSLAPALEFRVELNEAGTAERTWPVARRAGQYGSTQGT